MNNHKAHLIVFADDSYATKIFTRISGHIELTKRGNNCKFIIGLTLGAVFMCCWNFPESKL